MVVGVLVGALCAVTMSPLSAKRRSDPGGESPPPPPPPPPPSVVVTERSWGTTEEGCYFDSDGYGRPSATAVRPACVHSMHTSDDGSFTSAAAVSTPSAGALPATSGARGGAGSLFNAIATIRDATTYTVRVNVRIDEASLIESPDEGTSHALAWIGAWMSVFERSPEGIETYVGGAEVPTAAGRTATVLVSGVTSSPGAELVARVGLATSAGVGGTGAVVGVPHAVVVQPRPLPGPCPITYFCSMQTPGIYRPVPGAGLVPSTWVEPVRGRAEARLSGQIESLTVDVAA